MSEILTTMQENWVYWAVSVFAIVAAYIDGTKLKVPNKLTYPAMLVGFVFGSPSSPLVLIVPEPSRR